jgi:hypothetical protein
MTEKPTLTESELVELVRSADVRAPDSLHRSVQALVAARSPGARSAARGQFSGAFRPSLLPRAAIATALAAVLAVALVLGLSGGGAPGLSVRQASALTLRAATVPAPHESPSNRAQLAASVDGVSFPYWQDHFGWRSTGARSDRISGRSVTTVFYADSAGRRVGYAIVAGVQAHPPSGAVMRLHGTAYRVLVENGAGVVTWLRAGHLCVVSGRGVDSATLLQLASWGDSPGQSQARAT